MLDQVAVFTPAAQPVDDRRQHPALTYRADIEGLRGVAVMVVILFHAGIPGFSGGFIGVDVFFVISGFLITGLLTAPASGGSRSDFYLRRLRRLFPALAATVAATLLFAALIFEPGLLVETAKASIASVFGGANLYSWTHSGYFDAASHNQPLLHIWSLSLEEQFYLLWPLVILSLRKWPRALLGVTGALLLISLGLSEMMIKKDPQAAFFLLPGRMFLLLMGAMLYLVDQRRQGNEREGFVNEIALLIGLGTIGFAVSTFGDATPFPGMHAFLIGAGAVTVIAGGRARYSGWLLRNRVMVAIGTVSYSAYLAHWPVVVFATYSLQRPLNIWEGIAATLASLVMGAWMVRYIENPFRQRLPRQAPRPPARNFVLGCVAAVVILSIVAADAWRSGGWAWRLSEPAISHFANAKPIQPEQSMLPIGDKSRVDFVLVGDSHAGHFIPAFDWLGNRLGLGGLALVVSACSLLEGALTQMRGQVREVCTVGRENVFRAIDEKDPDRIVFSFDYDGYHGAFSDIDGKPLTWSTPGGFDAHWISLFENTFKRFRRPGRKFIVMGTGLRPGFDVSQCLRRPMILSRETAETRCKLAPRAATHPLDRAFEQMAAVHEDVIFIDPKASFCSAEKCIAWDATRIFFLDSHHLTPEGSLFVIQNQSAVFELALEHPPR